MGSVAGSGLVAATELVQLTASPRRVPTAYLRDTRSHVRETLSTRSALTRSRPGPQVIVSRAAPAVTDSTAVPARTD